MAVDNITDKENRLRMSIIFLHPDLGIGGAERAVVDAALAAKLSGYDVEIVTNSHDPNHAFEETVNGSLKITTVCQYLPRSIMGHFVAIMAFLKMILAAIWVAFARHHSVSLVYVDQVSAPLIILRLFGFKVEIAVFILLTLDYIFRSFS